VHHALAIRRPMPCHETTASWLVSNSAGFETLERTPRTNTSVRVCRTTSPVPMSHWQAGAEDTKFTCRLTVTMWASTCTSRDSAHNDTSASVDSTPPYTERTPLVADTPARIRRRCSSPRHCDETRKDRYGPPPDQYLSQSQTPPIARVQTLSAFSSFAVGRPCNGVITACVRYPHPAHPDETSIPRHQNQRPQTSAAVPSAHLCPLPC